MSWHNTYDATDIYMRTSNDDGATWSSSMRIVGESGVDGQDYNHHKGDWYISTTSQGYDFDFSPIPEGADFTELKVYQKGLEQSVRILCNGTEIVSAINGTNETLEWRSYEVPQELLNTDNYNTFRIEHNGGAADWGHIYEVLIHNSKKGEDSWNVEIISYNGNIFQKGNIATTLTAIVYKGGLDITDTIPINKFIWKKYFKDGTIDQVWTDTYAGGIKSVDITNDDVYQRATFMCDILE